MTSSNKREVCFLIGRGGEIIYADFSASPVALPDSRKRWHMMWENREYLAEVAHSHPVGTSRFSKEDETTMRALDQAFGKSLRYSVVAPTEMRVREGATEWLTVVEPWWAGLMRMASGMDSGKLFGFDNERKRENGNSEYYL